jgi:hypothetical protein
MSRIRFDGAEPLGAWSRLSIHHLAEKVSRGHTAFCSGSRCPTGHDDPSARGVWFDSASRVAGRFHADDRRRWDGDDINLGPVPILGRALLVDEPTWPRSLLNRGRPRACRLCAFRRDETERRLGTCSPTSTIAGRSAPMSSANISISSGPPTSQARTSLSRWSTRTMRWITERRQGS